MENSARMKIIIAPLVLLLAFSAGSLQAQEVSSRTYTLKDGSTLTYSKPGFLRTMGAMPADLVTFTRDSFSKDSLPWLGAITVSSLILIHYDQKIYNAVTKEGKKLSISSKDKTRPYLKIGGVSVFRGPADLGSGLYFIGDGWVTIGMFGYFKTAGWLKDDWRASQTGNELASGLIATGFVTELMKNISGRETPERSSAKGGVWRMFPGIGEYVKNRPRYDAFPSGHLATAVMSMTVLTENYPDNAYIKPIGYTLLTGLCFQMINNGVHWAGDYPLGFAVGYGIGKAIAGHGRTAAVRSGDKTASSLTFAPYINPDGALGPMLAYRF
jgi:hypothetical protein